MAGDAENAAKSFGIIGSGRIARSMGRLLAESGCKVVGLSGRDERKVQSAVEFIGCEAVSLEELCRRSGRLLIAVSDDAIEAVAAQMCPWMYQNALVLHTSGALGALVLHDFAKCGAHCGALHPLATVPTPEAGLRALKGAAFGFTGSDEARVWAQDIVDRLGGRLIEVPEENRVAYHAAAALASNAMPALVAAASRLLSGTCRVSEEEAARLLAPLARTSLENALSAGPVAALTGPVRRGDVRTIEKHIGAIAAAAPELGELYRALALQQVELAQKAGLGEEAAAKLKEAVER